jgi:biofilm PGA synthesis protein PgaD
MTHQEPEHPDIIYRPDLLPRRRRVIFSGMTLFAWGIWVYLFLPLISVLAWWVGIDLFMDYMLVPEERTYFVTLSIYLVVIAGAGLIIFAWSRYNQLRFQGHDRRAHVPAVSDQMTRARFRIDEHSLDQIHASKVMVLDLDQDGHICEITTRIPNRANLSSDN